MTTHATSPLSERECGFREAFQQFDALGAKWPKAFPARSHEVRPLASGAKQAAVDALGWNAGYGRAVLRSWTLRAAYCRAVLRYATRINLDGSASEEVVDNEARSMATERLEQIAARRAKDAAKLGAATEASARPNAAGRTAAATADATPRSGKLLLAGSAVMEDAVRRRLASGAMMTEVVKTVPAPVREERAS